LRNSAAAVVSKFFVCRVRVLGLFLAVLAGRSTMPAQSGDIPRPDSPDTAQIVEQLVQKNQTRSALLRHFQGCRHYALDYTGFPTGKSADMVVDVKFDAPAQKQFRIVRENGSQVLISRVLKELLENEKQAVDEQNRNRTALTPENYEFQLVGAEVINTRPQYVLEVIPRTKNKYLYRGKIWVDATDFAVSRISAEPAKNPSFWISHTQIEHEYKKFGEFWLPVRNTSVTKVRLGGTAKLNIDYSNYLFGLPTRTTDAGVCDSASSDLRLSEQR